MGYSRAGFEVVGVDIKPQPHYPFRFIQTDAVAYLGLFGREYDFIHASPPCQAYSITKHTHSNEYPELIDDIREFLLTTDATWVIENVVGAPMRNPLVLCGTMFDLKALDTDGTQLFLRRHRLFESNQLLLSPGPCQCAAWKRRGWLVGGVYGGGSSDRAHAKFVRRGGYTPRAAVRRELMDMDWSNQDELSEAIPPAYTEWIGRQLLATLERAA